MVTKMNRDKRHRHIILSGFKADCGGKAVVLRFREGRGSAFAMDASG